MMYPLASSMPCRAPANTEDIELTADNAETLAQYAAQWGCSPEQALLMIIMEAACQPSALTDG